VGAALGVSLTSLLLVAQPAIPKHNASVAMHAAG